MINVSDKVEIKGKITGLGTGTIDMELTEIKLDGAFRKFSPVKTLSINVIDYDSTFTAAEIDAIKHLVNTYKTNTNLPDDVEEGTLSIAKKIEEGVI